MENIFEKESFSISSFLYENMGEKVIVHTDNTTIEGIVTGINDDFVRIEQLIISDLYTNIIKMEKISSVLAARTIPKNNLKEYKQKLERIKKLKEDSMKNN